jgi:O-antigen/teichoic acid export membrane protein
MKDDAQTVEGASAIVASSTRGGVAKFLALFADPVRRYSILEQVLLSATNFIFMLLLARHFSRESFGFFSGCWVGFYLLLSLHRAFVVVPFVIETADHALLRKAGRTWRRYNVLVLGVFTALCLMVAGGLSFWQEGGGWLAGMTMAAMLLMIPGAYQELNRRWSIQVGNIGAVLLAAAVYSAILLLGAGLAIRLENIWLALVGLWLAAFAAAVTSWVRNRAFRIDAEFEPLRRFVGERRGYFAWSGISAVAYNGYNQIPPLILTILAGPSAVALFQATRTFTQPMSVLMMAVDNFDRPRAIRSLNAGGMGQMFRQLLKATLVLFVMCMPIWLVLGLFPHQIIHLVYGGAYADGAVPIYLWIAFSVVSILAYPAETSLYVLKRPELVGRGRIWAGVASVAVCVATIPALGANGALLGVITGWALSGSWSFWKFRRHMKQNQSIQAQAKQDQPAAGA